MNYRNLYHRFISSRPKRKKAYYSTESHHILPRSLGGSNHRSNIIILTPKEHFIAHRILAKMYEGKQKNKMIYALNKMKNTGRYRMTARTYEHLRTEYKKRMYRVWEHRSPEELRAQSLRLWQDPTYRANQMSWRRNLGPISEAQKQKCRATWDKKRLPKHEHIKQLLAKWAKDPATGNRLAKRKYKIKQILNR